MPFKRTMLSVVFDDPNDWHDRRSEELVGQAMKELESAVLKLTGREQFWERATGYWRCGENLFPCRSQPSAEPEFLPPPATQSLQVSQAAITSVQQERDEDGADAIKIQAEFRVVHGIETDLCAKLQFLLENGAPVSTQNSGAFSDVYGNLAAFCQLERSPGIDVTYTVNFVVPYHAFGPVPDRRESYQVKLIILRGHISQPSLEILCESKAVRFNTGWGVEPEREDRSLRYRTLRFVERLKEELLKSQESHFSMEKFKPYLLETYAFREELRSRGAESVVLPKSMYLLPQDRPAVLEVMDELEHMARRL